MSPLARILLLMGSLLIFVQIHRSSGAVLATELASAGLSPTEIANVVGALFIASALFQIPTGLLFDRVGPRRTVAYLNIVSIAGIFVFAASTDPFALASGRFLIGLGQGGTIAAIYLMAFARVEPHRVSTVVGVAVAISGGVGGALATTPLLFSLREFGQFATFATVGLATALVTFAVYCFIEDSAQEKNARAAPESIASSMRGFVEVARDKKLLPIYAIGACFALPFHSVGGLWAGPYLTDVHELSKETTSYVLLAMVIAFHLGNMIYGPAERLFNTRKWVIAGGVCFMLATLNIVSIWPGLGVELASIGLILFACCASFYPTLVAHCRAFVPLERAGRAIACINLLGMSLLYLVQTITGWIVEATSAPDGRTTALGYELSFALIGLVLAGALSAYLSSDDRRPERRA